VSDSWRKRGDKKREPLFFWGTSETVQRAASNRLKTVSPSTLIRFRPCERVGKKGPAREQTNMSIFWMQKMFEDLKQQQAILDLDLVVV
jgi:hypothetical protein